MTLTTKLITLENVVDFGLLCVLLVYAYIYPSRVYPTSPWPRRPRHGRSRAREARLRALELEVREVREARLREQRAVPAAASMVDLGFGRLVVSEREAPILSVHLV